MHILIIRHGWCCNPESRSEHRLFRRSCRRILCGRKLVVYIRTVETAIFDVISMALSRAKHTRARRKRAILDGAGGGAWGGGVNLITFRENHFQIYCSSIVSVTWANVEFNRWYLVVVPNVRAQNDILVLFRQLCGFSFFANFPALIFSAAFYLRVIPTL